MESSKARTMADEPPNKRQKVSNQSNQSNQFQSNQFTTSEMKELLQLFKHLESEKVQNRTLDLCIFDSYKSLSQSLNNHNDDNDDEDNNKEDETLQAVESMVTHKTVIPCNVFFEQLIQTKAQIKAMRLLSRDLGVSTSLSQLSHGIDNVHSWQRPFIDPLQTQNPSTCKPSKYNLNARSDDIIIDSTPQTVEELVYQSEYDGMKQLVQRRRMLKDYIAHCQTVKKSKNKFDAVMYKKSCHELQILELAELQRKVRNDVLHCRLDRHIYDEDNGDNEALLNPDLFARTAQIGLHFDPHISLANHPPAMATSKDIFPFYYLGQK